MTNVIDWTKYDKNVDTEALNKDLVEAQENGGGEYREVTPGEYEVRIEKMELRQSKKGDPMVSIWFKILEGQFKNSIIFYNQVINAGFQMHLNNEFLRSLDSGIDIPSKFTGYADYEDMLIKVYNSIQEQNLEYALDYGKNNKGFNTYEITDIFEAE